MTCSPAASYDSLANIFSLAERLGSDGVGSGEYRRLRRPQYHTSHTAVTTQTGSEYLGIFCKNHQITGFPFFDTLWLHYLQIEKHLLLPFLIYYSAIRNKMVAQNALHNEEEFKNLSCRPARVLEEAYFVICCIEMLTTDLQTVMALFLWQHSSFIVLVMPPLNMILWQLPN